MRRYEPKYESVEVEITTAAGGSSYGQNSGAYGAGGSSYGQYNGGYGAGGSSYGQNSGGYGAGGSSYGQNSGGYGPAERSIRASGVGASVRNTSGGNTGDMLFGIF